MIAQRVCSRVKRVVELPEGSKRSYMTIIEKMTVKTGGQNLFHHDFFSCYANCSKDLLSGAN